MRSIAVRIVCKIYEYVLRAYSFVFFVVFSKRMNRNANDPSLILCENLTPLQNEIQGKLTQLRQTISPVGEVLIVIPFRDRWDLTEACLESLNSQVFSSQLSVRTILVDNNSTESETLAQVSTSPQRWPELKIECLKAAYEFNYSKLNNDAVRRFANIETKWILFLNNDVEFVDHSILTRMIEALALHSDVGVVGCTLLYPDRTIQHLFAAPGVKIVAAHPLKHEVLRPGNAWEQRSLRVVPAVTGAVMLLRASDFSAVGMFDEALPTLGQDIDLCLSIFAKLRLVPAVVTTTSVIHHESKTKKAGFKRAEIELIYKKWDEKIFDSSLYSQRFSRWSEKPVLQPFQNELRYPWHLIV